MSKLNTYKENSIDNGEISLNQELSKVEKDFFDKVNDILG
jgi:hypothetical protein